MLKVHTRKLGSVAVLCLQGRIVNGEAATLRDAVNSQSRVSAIAIDLSRVSAVDASGLGLLLQLRREMQSRGVRLKLMNASKFVRRIFEITRLDSVFEVTSEVPAISPRPSPMIGLARCA